MRRQDAVPDELEIVPDGRLSKQNSSSSLLPVDSPALAPVPAPVPLMVVEKVDPDSPSHGEVPGTTAYEKRQADAAPDVVLKASESNHVPQSFSLSHTGTPASPGSIPEIIKTRADSIPRLDEEAAVSERGSRSNVVMPSVQEHAHSGEGKQ